MATPEMKAGDQTLSRAATMVSAAKADLDKIVKNLDGQVVPKRAHWQGQGGTAFFTLFDEWAQKQSKITAALDEFEAALRRTQNDNVNTDQTQHSSMTNLTGRLGSIGYTAS